MYFQCILYIQYKIRQVMFFLLSAYKYKQKKYVCIPKQK